jgi:hypothetical protein
MEIFKNLSALEQQQQIEVRSEFLTALSMKNIVILDLTPCILLDICRRLGGRCQTSNQEGRRALSFYHSTGSTSQKQCSLRSYLCHSSRERIHTYFISHCIEPFWLWLGAWLWDWQAISQVTCLICKHLYEVRHLDSIDANQDGNFTEYFCFPDFAESYLESLPYHINKECSGFRR